MELNGTLHLDVLKNVLAGGKFAQAGGIEQHNYRVMPLLSRARSYAALLAAPWVRTLMGTIMGAVPYMLSSFTSYVVGSGSSEGSFHQDGRADVHERVKDAAAGKRCEARTAAICLEHTSADSPGDMMVSALVYLNDISEANGATQFVNASHGWTDEQHLRFDRLGPRQHEYATSSAPGQKGSVLLLDARTWHRSGEFPITHELSLPRATLLMAFAPPFQENIDLLRASGSMGLGPDPNCQGGAGAQSRSDWDYRNSSKWLFRPAG